jgi:hypothetical protein
MPVLTVPYTPDIDNLCAAAHIAGPADRARFTELLAEAAKRPGSALYAARRAAANGAVPPNLFRDGETVYPFVATCGPAMEAYGETLADPLERLWWDAVMLDAVSQTYKALKREIEALAGWPPSTVCPGTIDGWPMSAQPALFAWVGGVGEAIGVTLSESNIMRPIKSLSGILCQGGGPESDMI